VGTGVSPVHLNLNSAALPATCHLLFAVILSEAHFAERRIYAFEPKY
jgi:hypothetical protein